MNETAVSLDVLLRAFLLYGILPAWVFFGFIDYLCHRVSKIEETTGLRETLLHSLMGLQIGVPIFLGLFFEINVLLLMVMLAVLIMHEYVAHLDVKTAYGSRNLLIWELHAHSFLEVIPFVIFGLIVLLKWTAFVDLVTLNWGGGFSITLKKAPINGGFIASYFIFMILLGFIPYTDELLRCLRARFRKAA